MPGGDVQPVSDRDLVCEVRDGDVSAFGLLHERHVDAARALARRIAAEADVDDVVAESFARLFAQLRRGGGPDEAVRPYLLTILRRVAIDRYRLASRQVVVGDMQTLDPGAPFTDPAVAGLERALIARAFVSLPERWQAVLWHTEIDVNIALRGIVSPIILGPAAAAYLSAFSGKAGVGVPLLWLRHVPTHHKAAITIATGGAVTVAGLVALALALTGSTVTVQPGRHAVPVVVSRGTPHTPGLARPHHS